MPGTKKQAVKTDEPYSFRVGTIVGIKGLNGEVKLKLDSDFDLVEAIESAELHVLDQDKPGKTLLKVKVRSIVMHAKSVLMRIQSFDSRLAIEPLIGADIYTQKGQLRELEEDEFWFGDLVGLTAYTTGGATIGTISAVIESGNYLLEITAGEKTHLVPFVKELVPTVDIAGRRVEITAIPGLLD
jgi:16S rRNA processing protein RimM